MSSSDTGAGSHGHSKVMCGGIPSIAPGVARYHWSISGAMDGTSTSIDESIARVSSISLQSAASAVTVARCTSSSSP